MPKNIIGAWRAFSTLVQTNIATAQAVDSMVPFTGDLAEPEPDQLYTNKDEITGKVAPTKHRLLTKKFMVKQKSKAFPHLVAMFASMAMGKDTSALVGATLAYKHKLEIDKTIVELPKRTMVENDGYAQKKFKGLACSGFTLSCKRDEFLDLEADLMGAGDEAVDATAEPTESAESYLTYGDMKLFKGGAFDGTAVTGSTDLSGPLVDFSFAFKNGAKGVHLIGDSTGNYGSIRRGNAFTYDLKAKFELEDGSHRTDLLAGNEFVLDVPFIGGVADGTAHYEVELVFPRVIYKAAKKAASDGTLEVGGEFEVLADPVYGALVIFVTNLQAASYLAAA